MPALSAVAGTEKAQVIVSLTLSDCLCHQLVPSKFHSLNHSCLDIFVHSCRRCTGVRLNESRKASVHLGVGDKC